MVIRVKLFAILRERAGVSEATLDLPDNSTAKAASEALVTRFPAIADSMSGVAFAINQGYSPSSTLLQAGDELALIPPVSGG